MHGFFNTAGPTEDFRERRKLPMPAALLFKYQVKTSATEPKLLWFRLFFCLLVEQFWTSIPTCRNWKTVRAEQSNIVDTSSYTQDLPCTVYIHVIQNRSFWLLQSKVSIFVPLCNFVNFLIFFLREKFLYRPSSIPTKYENNHGVNT